MNERDEVSESDAESNDGSEFPSSTADTLKLAKTPNNEEQECIGCAVELPPDSMISNSMKNEQNSSAPALATGNEVADQLLTPAVECNVVEHVETGGVCSIVQAEKGAGGIHDEDQKRPSEVASAHDTLTDADILDDVVHAIPDSLGDGASHYDHMAGAVAPGAVEPDVNDSNSSDSDDDLFVSPTPQDSREAEVSSRVDCRDNDDNDGDGNLHNRSTVYGSSRVSGKPSVIMRHPIGLGHNVLIQSSHTTDNHDAEALNELKLKQTPACQNQNQDLIVTISSSESTCASYQTTQPVAVGGTLSNSPEFNSERSRKSPKNLFPKMAHWTFVVSGIGKDTDQVCFRYQLRNANVHLLY
jgi:hypothetical protein